MCTLTYDVPFFRVFFCCVDAAAMLVDSDSSSVDTTRVERPSCGSASSWRSKVAPLVLTLFSVVLQQIRIKIVLECVERVRYDRTRHSGAGSVPCTLGYD